MRTSRQVIAPDALKHTSRIRKVICIPDNYIARVSKATMLRYGTPICPACRNSMVESRGGN